MNKNMFSYVLFLSVELKDKQICFLDHLTAKLSLFVFKLIHLVFMFNNLSCIPISLFSTFCVSSVSLSSFHSCF